MPTCPKCGKLISAGKYKRHLQRCGQTHKHKAAPLHTSGDDYYMRM